MTEAHEETGTAGMDVSDLRRSAEERSLNREDLCANPLLQFEAWFKRACKTLALDPNAMSLCTVDERQRPYSRTVLLKSFDERGFVFYTNHESRKASHIRNSAEVALLLFWRELGQQIGIRGTAERLSSAESFQYFASRPRGSQLGAWVSPQSSVIGSRALLKQRLAAIRRQFADKNVPLPPFWGGYRVVPREVEFWQGRNDRLHDRFLYSREDGGWQLARLAP